MVGQAWVTTDDTNVKSVRVAVGLVRYDPTVKRLVEHQQAQAEVQASLDARVAALENARSTANASELSVPVSWLLVGGGVLAAFVLGRRWRG